MQMNKNHPPSKLLSGDDGEDIRPAIDVPDLGPNPKAKDVIRAAMEVALSFGTVQGLTAAAAYAEKLAPYESPKLNAIANVTPPPPDTGPRLDASLLDADERATLRELLLRASSEDGEVVENEPQPRGLITSAAK